MFLSSKWSQHFIPSQTASHYVLDWTFTLHQHVLSWAASAKKRQLQVRGIAVPLFLADDHNLILAVHLREVRRGRYGWRETTLLHYTHLSHVAARLQKRTLTYHWNEPASWTSVICALRSVLHHSYWEVRVWCVHAWQMLRMMMQGFFVARIHKYKYDLSLAMPADIAQPLDTDI